MQKKKYTVDDLMDILARLRGEGGCPWDKVQTHDTIKKNMIEEAYEAVDALEKGDDAMFANELGDVLLQVAFHAQIARERDAFGFNDVVGEICRKMIDRHTHVFGSDSAEDDAQALDTWEKNKKKEKGLSTQTELMRDVIHMLPSLIRAEKVQKKAADVGFDWADVDGALRKSYEEIGELEQAIASSDQANIEEEIGDLLFSVVNVSRFCKINAEEALRHATDKFINRFEILEKNAQQLEKKLSEITLDEMEDLWQKAKLQKK